MTILAIFLAALADDPLAVSVPVRAKPVSYAKEVAEILEAKCVGCHSSALAENKLNIEEIKGMLKGGKRGPALVPGKSEESRLFLSAAHRAEPAMPPKDKKDAKPLTPAELGLLKLWIDSGAKDDTAENSAPAKPIVLGELPPGVQPINAVDMTDDGQRVAIGRANVVQVHDVDSGLEIVSLGGHRDLIQSIRWSRDGRYLAAGSYQIATVWNAPFGGPLKTFAGHNDVVRAAVASRDRNTIYSASADRTLCVWNVAESKVVARFTLTSPLTSLAISPDGKTLAAGAADGVIHVLDSNDGKEKAALKGHVGAVSGVAFFSDGRRIASAGADGVARVWRIADAPDRTADPIILNGHGGAVHAVAASPDGQFVVTGGEDRTVRIWHAVDGKVSRVIDAHEGPVLSLALDRSGKLLLTGSGDKFARLFEFDTGTLIERFLAHSGPVNAVAFDPSGERFATAGGEGGMQIRETSSRRVVLAFGHAAPNGQPIQPILALAFLGDDRIVSASADKTLRTWSFEGRWSELSVLGPHAFRVLCLDFHPHGGLLAAGGGDPSRSGEIKLWEVGKGSLVRTLDSLHSDTVFGVRFSPDGQKLASCAGDKFLKVTSVATGKELRSFEGHTNHVLAVDWSDDGKRLVTGGADNLLKVWDYDAGEQLRTLQPAGKQITALRWIGGRGTVAGASGDKLVRLWNPNNGAVERVFNGPSDYVYGVGAAKDGSRVAAGGADSVLFIWRADGQLVRKLEPPAANAKLAGSTKPAP
jgi:WD40 repeat protein